MACVEQCIPENLAAVFGLDKDVKMTKKDMVELVTNYVMNNLSRKTDNPSVYVLDDKTKMLFNVDDSVEVTVFNIRQYIADVFKRC